MELVLPRTLIMVRDLRDQYQCLSENIKLVFIFGPELGEEQNHVRVRIEVVKALVVHFTLHQLTVGGRLEYLVAHLHAEV